MNRRLAFMASMLGAAGMGAGLMYFLDPDRGARRRALVRHKATSAATRMSRATDALGGLSRDMRNRAYGVVAETRSRMRKEDVDDAVLEARVRSQMGHKIRHADGVEVTADHGRVTIAGRHAAAEAEALRACVAAVRGVKQIADRIEVH
jgi:osmotically-inducible protein OsmY